MLRFLDAQSTIEPINVHLRPTPLAAVAGCPRRPTEARLRPSRPFHDERPSLRKPGHSRRARQTRLQDQPPSFAKHLVRLRSLRQPFSGEWHLVAPLKLACERPPERR